MYYRDEDGELRPVRLDRSGLADVMLEDIAAEYLRAKADAEAAPYPWSAISSLPCATRTAESCGGTHSVAQKMFMSAAGIM